MTQEQQVVKSGKRGDSSDLTVNQPSLTELVSANEQFAQLVDNSGEDVDMEHTLTECDMEESIKDNQLVTKAASTIRKQQSETASKAPPQDQP
jgi:hypothetical protein